MTNISEERARLAEGVALAREKHIELVRALHDKGYSHAAIANILRTPESTVQISLDQPVSRVWWGYNCLTDGIHHGRPEKLWNLPVLYAAQIFSAEHLKDLVVARIYNDAMQYVEHSDTDHHITTQQWAEQIKVYAESWFRTTLQHTVGEISLYYKTPGRKTDVDMVVKLVQEGKLNRGYEPLHGHDSLNLLCRILGTKCSREASKDHE